MLRLPYVENLKVKPRLQADSSLIAVPDFEGQTIMIADDQEMIHKFLNVVLRPTKIKIIHVYDGFEVLDKLKEHREVSLLLMDLQMPNQDGYQTLAVLKKEYSYVKVIAQTAFAQDSDMQKTLAGVRKAVAFSKGNLQLRCWFLFTLR